MTDFLKEVGTTEGSSDSLKMEVNKTSKLISTGPQERASNPIRSCCFPDVHSLSSLRTSSSEKVIAQTLLLCLLLSDVLIGRIAPPLTLHSKRP